MSESPPLEPQTFDDLRDERVQVRVFEDDIEIRTLSSASFKAWVDDGRIAHLTIHTLRSTGARDPYFEEHHASELARRAITYFDQYEPVRGLAFDWGQPTSDDALGRSDNYITYLNARNELAGSMDYEAAKKLAALQTWTFRNVALPLQFSEIDTVIEKDDPAAPTSVLGVAYRPDVPEAG